MPRLFQVTVERIYTALARRHDTGDSDWHGRKSAPPKLLACHDAIQLNLKGVPDLTVTASCRTVACVGDEHDHRRRDRA